MDQALRENLLDWLRIPSISTGGGDATDLERAAEWVCERVRAAGGEAGLVRIGAGNPLAVGDLSAADPDAPTVLIYGHYDVQGVGDPDAWESPPFEPTQRGERIYARGAADDKGNFLPLLHAACSMAAAGELPVNVRVLVEGEEEAGGASVEQWVRDDERRVDCAIVFDSGMEDVHTPAITLGLRGIVATSLTVTAQPRDLHSGLYGGVTLNAAHVLHRILGAVLPGPDGVLRDELREGITPPSQTELDSWAALRPSHLALDEIGARPVAPGAGDLWRERTGADASLDVNMLATGAERTIVPAQARAFLTLRLAPRQDPERMRDVLEGLLRDALPEGAELETEHMLAAPTLIDADLPAVKLAREAIERATEMTCALTRSGGSIPVVGVMAARGWPVIVSGFGTAEDEIHAPNESFRLESLDLGERAGRELLRTLAALPRADGATVLRAARLSAGIVALATALWALVGRGLVNYDTLYSLVWGREIVQGRTPDLDALLAPTPHPLATLAGVIAYPLSVASDAGVHGEAAQTATIIFAFLALAVLGWVVYALGTAWFDPWVGVLAAAIILTRRPVLDFGARAYVDIPYVALVLGALLVETRRPRAGLPVLALLAVAGLIRPEAWLFSAAYFVYLVWRGERDTGRLLLLAVVAASAPLLWALADWVIAGSPLHSLTGTRDNAATLGRVTGLDDVPLTVPRRLGEILREPVLIGAAGGLLLSWLWLRDRVRPAIVAALLALAAFCVLAAAGLPILGRYLLLPAAIGAVLCAAGAFGWRSLPQGDPRRRPWAWFSAVTLVLLLAFVPSQAGRISDLRDALRIQDSIQDDLRALVRVPPGALSPACTPVGVPNHRPVPLLALWLNVDPARVVSLQERSIARGAYARPATARVAHDYILDPRDLDKAIPPPPPGFNLVAGNRSWRVFKRCAPDVRVLRGA